MSARLLKIPRIGLLILLATAEFVLTLDLSIVNVALPDMRSALGFSQSSLQWVVNAYALSFAGFLLLGGRAADLLGGRRVFLAALAGFTVSSLTCGLADSQGVLIAGRVAQGLSAAALSPTTLSILTATYREPEERRRVLSIWTAVAIGGGAVGALFGGILTGSLSWRWIFFVNVPIGAVLLLAAPSLLSRERPAGPVRGRFDVAGAVTVTVGLTALTWALIRTDAVGWGSAEVLAALATAAAALAGFAVVETRLAGAPLVPFSVFHSRAVAAGNLTSFLSFIPVMATWFFLTLYLQRVRGFSPLETGLLFLPMSLGVIAGSQASFRLIARLDARLLFTTGALLAAAAMAWLSFFSTTTALAWVIAPASIAMVGGGLMFAPITISATAVGPEQGGLAGGLLNMTRQIGGALGLALLGTVAASAGDVHAGDRGTPALAGGYADAFEIAAVIFLATALVGALTLPRRLDARPAEQGRASRADNGVRRERVAAARPAEANPGWSGETKGLWLVTPPSCQLRDRGGRHDSW